MERNPAANGQKAGSRWLRTLDFAVGVALLWALRPFRRRKKRPTMIARIGLIKADGMGDIVLLTGVLHDLKSAFPAAQITIFGGNSIAALAAEIESIDFVKIRNFTRPWQVVHAARAERLNVMINCGQWSRCEALIAGLSGANFVVGFNTPGQHQHALYDATVPHRNDRHELENFRSLVEPLGLVSRTPPSFSLRRSTSREPGWIMFHLWPSGVTHVALKRWPEAFWAELARRCNNAGFKVLLSGGPQDFAGNEHWLKQQNLDSGKIENRAGCKMKETLAMISMATAVVSVNTGVMHLAAALNVPTIGLHGPTNAKRWGPVGEKTAVCDVSSPAGGYLNLGFEYPEDAWQRPGIETITVDEVWGKLLQWLAQPAAQSAANL